ncbi:MAG TPA: hypothetical protein VIR01_01905 [Pyrinomonadaceae bacterium]
MKIFWMAIAGVCAVCAGVFLLQRDFDKAFILAAAGAIAWFLNYRVQMKEIVDRADHEENDDLSDET